MKKEIKGYITVFLSLILGIMLSLTFTILKAAREQVIKAEIEGVTDISLFSVFGEYHKELLQRYDLFAIDSGYGGKSNGSSKIEERMHFYMNKNFNKSGEDFISLISGGSDITRITCDSVSIKEYLLLSDQEGQVLKDAILSYMHHKKGTDLVGNSKRNYTSLSTLEQSSISIEEQWENMGNEIKRKLEERNNTSEEEVFVLDSPADYVEARKAEGPLSLALPPGKEISGQIVDKEIYFSQRTKKKGTIAAEYKPSVFNQLTAKEYLEEYYFEKCGYYDSEKEGSLLQYQIEYLLHGHKEDKKNLEKTVERILLIREGINLTYLMANSGKLAEAEVLATLISTACLMPELKEPLKAVIIFAWCYAESIQDIRILLDGKKAADVKTDDTWNTPLSQLLSFTSYLGEYKSPEQGMSYQDYLQFFLWTKNDKEVLFRFMDICEMDLRSLTGNMDFSMDQCVVMLNAASFLSSSYGGDYKITRSRYYE